MVLVIAGLLAALFAHAGQGLQSLGLDRTPWRLADWCSAAASIVVGRRSGTGWRYFFEVPRVSAGPGRPGKWSVN
ncbi:MAG UNVERIFIED_CONTAM: hypothetical protein LVR18_43130 [Planctomycetaceae bacterium]|jgi:hypothetical protein